MINKRGFWEDNGISNHKYDSSLNSKIIEILKEKNIESILDLGCGPGDYAKEFVINNFDCDCFDGNPNTPEISKDLCKVADLSEPTFFGRKYDCVLSLEVGEHIPPEFESIFIKNIIDHSKNLIILSWATIGQGGHGHFNEKPNDYIESKFYEYGFSRDKGLEFILRESAEWWWFKNTIMVFKK